MKVSGSILTPMRRASYVERWQSKLAASISTSSRSGKELSLEEIVSYCKRHHFAVPASEIYGGIGTGYDYGHLGSLLKKNIQDAWFRDFISTTKDILFLDSSILLNPNVWKSSGHVDLFADPISECAKCKKAVRVDKLLLSLTQDEAQQALIKQASVDELFSMLEAQQCKCPACGNANSLSRPRMFNLLFETQVGPVLKSTSVNAFLRPETAQGAYVNYLSMLQANRKKIPFGIAQAGKSFRNEIGVHNFVFRTREFEQMELQYFTFPSAAVSKYQEYVLKCKDWLLKYGIQENKVKLNEYSTKELAHYALATTDIEYNYPWGFDEVWGIAYRGDFDLKTHSNKLGLDFAYSDPGSNTSFVPHVIEPAVGLNRLFLAFLSDGLRVEQLQNNEVRTVFHIHEELAPIKVVICPLMKKEPMMEFATKLHERLLEDHGLAVELDVSQSIGKRYRRADEIGVPLCITVDQQTSADNTVTVRDRDTMKQVRVEISTIHDFASRRMLKPSSFKF
jgi:glycyl-tRNA synthetase